MPALLAFAECRGNGVRKVAFEAISAARAAAGNGEVHALLIGGPGKTQQAEALGPSGADAVFVVEHPELERYSPEVFAATAAERLRAGDYRAAVFSASAQGRDLAPRVAAKLRVGLASDVTSFDIKGD